MVKQLSSSSHLVPSTRQGAAEVSVARRGMLTPPPKRSSAPFAECWGSRGWIRDRQGPFGARMLPSRYCSRFSGAACAALCVILNSGPGPGPSTRAASAGPPTGPPPGACRARSAAWRRPPARRVRSTNSRTGGWRGKGRGALDSRKRSLRCRDRRHGRPPREEPPLVGLVVSNREGSGKLDRRKMEATTSCETFR